MMTPSPIFATPTSANMPLPPLQRITPTNAGRVHLLRTLQIPGFKPGTPSQCSVTFSPDGKLLTGVCYQNTVPVWDVQSGQLLLTLESSPVQDVAVAFSPDGNQIAAGGFSENIRLWDAVTGGLVQTIGLFSSPIWDLAFSPTGDMLASANFNKGFSSDSSTISNINLWSILNGELRWNYVEDNTRLLVLSVDYAPDGKTIAYGTFDKVLVLDAETGQLIRSLSIPDHVGDLAFSSDGRFLATGSDDRKIRLWSTDNYDLLAALEGHAHYVNGVAFSPDGRLLASGSHDGNVGIWDVENGRMLQMLKGHKAAVLRVAVNSSGTLIASISWDGTVRLWGMEGE
jgi:WD40 repeat protein